MFSLSFPSSVFYLSLVFSHSPSALKPRRPVDIPSDSEDENIIKEEHEQEQEQPSTPTMKGLAIQVEEEEEEER